VSTYRIDERRSACLCDVGAPDYAAVTAVDTDGTTHFVLARRDRIGDGQTTYDAACPDVVHEQTGDLPIEHVRRIAIAARKHRGRNDNRREQNR
jgi:hypothetical protein